MGNGENVVMIPWLHLTPGDYLLFQSWRPTSVGAMVGACISLAFLAIFDRWVASTRSLLERRWRHRGLSLSLRSKNSSPDEKSLDVTVPFTGTIPPFILAHDLPRGLMYAAQALVAYVLMLSVMTFNVGFLISIIVGLGVGEMAFGRSIH